MSRATKAEISPNRDIPSLEGQTDKFHSVALVFFARHGKNEQMQPIVEQINNETSVTSVPYFTSLPPPRPGR